MLYLVITEEYGKGRSALEIAKFAIAGGVDIIQMREKGKPEDELLTLGRSLAGLCKKKRVSFIVNDDPILARNLDADGVHLGQEDAKLMPVAKARQIMGPGKTIGISTHSVEELRSANKSGADYIAFGPIFHTKTKDYFLGTKDIEKVLEISTKPVFFIGGITLSNIDEVLVRGARNIALIRAITEADNIPLSVINFKNKLKSQKRTDKI